VTTPGLRSRRSSAPAIATVQDREAQPNPESDPVDHPAETEDEGRDLAAVPDGDLAGALEAILLVVDAPAPAEALAAAVGHPPDRVGAELRMIADRYAAACSGIDLREVGGGWRLYTRDRFAPVVERFVIDGQHGRLSKAALETLAVIAYRQPVTRARIAAIRGVNVDGVVRTLTTRGLVEDVGTDAGTGATLYRTTTLFLERLGLSSLDELPALGPLLPDIDSIDELT
jgi:segregation and condensation protein B